MYDLIVIGGGAAGMFGAIQAKAQHPECKVVLLEKSAKLLSKLKVSGGGRCNVTHGCFDPSEFVKNYPRGNRELRGPFSKFQAKDTVEWFESRGVPLKIESDGRMFPVTDSSETIIDCLVGEAEKLGVEIRTRQRLDSLNRSENGFEVESFSARKLLIATGSSKAGYEWAEQLGHTIQDPVPSLFTFNVPTSPLRHLSGISLDFVTISIPGTKLRETGPLLITHFGFSGPAILKLSAWGARALYEKNYRFSFSINWLPGKKTNEIEEVFFQLKKEKPNKSLNSENPFKFPRKLWKELIQSEKLLNNYSLKELKELVTKLQNDSYLVEGKTTNKEEFVTCGGVSLKEVNFKTMESKICPGLYFAGEILDIDGVTGGFNFQNAWTTSYLAASSIA